VRQHILGVDNVITDFLEI